MAGDRVRTGHRLPVVTGGPVTGWNRHRHRPGSGNRTNPARQSSPLVQGSIPVQLVTFWAVSEAILLCAGASMLPQGIWVRLSFLGLVLLTAWVNVFQKRSHHVSPLAIDYLFGVAMAAPIPLSTTALGGKADRAEIFSRAPSSSTWS